MDQSCSSIADFWTSFKPVVPYTPSPDSYQPKPEPRVEYPISYFDVEAFYDSVADGNGPSYHYVKPDCPFSYPCVKADDDHLVDQNNNNNNDYCDLTTYQHYAEDIPQIDICSSVAQEVVVYTIDDSSPCSFEQQQREQNLPQDPPAIMEKHNDVVTIKQELPEEVKVEQEEVEFSSKKSPLKLPLKKRRVAAGFHNKFGKYACQSCERTFNRQSHLTQHRNAHHSGPMDQRCATCGKRFRLAEDLERHELRHKEQNKSFSCEHCPKRFNYKFDMIRHVKAVHTEAPHKCQFCGKGVVRYDHLLLHENKHRRMMSNAAVRQVSARKRKRDEDDKVVCDSQEKVKIEPTEDVDEGSAIN